MTKLSKYEKETIINWNEAENTASIYTAPLRARNIRDRPRPSPKTARPRRRLYPLDMAEELRLLQRPNRPKAPPQTTARRRCPERSRTIS